MKREVYIVCSLGGLTHSTSIYAVIGEPSSMLGADFQHGYSRVTHAHNPSCMISK